MALNDRKCYGGRTTTSFPLVGSPEALRRDDGKNGRRKEGRKVEARKGEEAKISKDGRHLS